LRSFCEFITYIITLSAVLCFALHLMVGTFFKFCNGKQNDGGLEAGITYRVQGQSASGVWGYSFQNIKTNM